MPFHNGKHDQYRKLENERLWNIAAGVFIIIFGALFAWMVIWVLQDIAANAAERACFDHDATIKVKAGYGIEPRWRGDAINDSYVLLLDKDGYRWEWWRITGEDLCATGMKGTSWSREASRPSIRRW